MAEKLDENVTIKLEVGEKDEAPSSHSMADTVNELELTATENLAKFDDDDDDDDGSNEEPPKLEMMMTLDPVKSEENESLNEGENSRTIACLPKPPPLIRKPIVLMPPTLVAFDAPTVEEPPVEEDDYDENNVFVPESAFWHVSSIRSVLRVLFQSLKTHNLQFKII